MSGDKIQSCSCRLIVCCPKLLCALLTVVLTQIRYASLLATKWLFERLGNRQAGRAQAPQKGTRNPPASVRAEEKRDAPIPPVDSAV